MASINKPAMPANRLFHCACRRCGKQFDIDLSKVPPSEILAMWKVVDIKGHEQELLSNWEEFVSLTKKVALCKACVKKLTAAAEEGKAARF